MTSVVFSRDASVGFVGFSVSGHSGYAEEGGDIVCSAISSCTELVLNQLDAFGIVYELAIDSRNADVRCFFKKVSNDCKNDQEPQRLFSVILEGFHKTVDDISKEYPRFVKCTITEV